MSNIILPMKEDELERLYDEHCENPVMQRRIASALYTVRQLGEDKHGPSFIEELRQAWREDIQDSIEFLKEDIGLLADIKETMNSDYIRQYCEYLIRIELEDLKGLYNNPLPEWLR